MPQAPGAADPQRSISDAETQSMSVPLGATLKARYHIERPLGSGGFGTVYLAADNALHGRRVVVKLLHEQQGAREWIQRKFREECEALARLHHPGIVGVIDQGQTAEGKPFLVMEYVEGVTLRDVLRSGPMDLKRAGRLLCNMGKALGTAHEHGVYHRDLKPENIVIRDVGNGEEMPVIIDFGIATVLKTADTGDALTLVAGSARYMAPEQMEGKPEAASDIYALAEIAYEMLTGALPFYADTTEKLFLQRYQPLKRKICDLRPAVPLAAQDAIERALSPDPKLRPSDACEFAAELERSLARAAAAAEAPTAVLDRRSTAWRVIVPAVLTIAAAAAITFGWLLHPAAKTAGPALPLLHSFDYWLLEQPFRSGRPAGVERRLEREMLFPTGFGIALMVKTTEPGHLYVVNEGPGEGGRITWNTLFPTLANNGGSSLLPGDAEIRIPGQHYFRFDDKQGTENLWLIWSSAAIPQLEALQRWIGISRGEVRDGSEVDYLRTLTQGASPAAARPDEAAHWTVISRRGDPVVHDVKLEHN
jgi:tRNA A-37 threonylcarbamoyl transferase component Bud32